MSKKSWIEVDLDGLAKLIADRPKVFIIHELLQNTLDECRTGIKIVLEMLAGRPVAKLRVEDSAPEGFKDFSHAWTMFAESHKKGDPKKGGRYNLGEKLVLSQCVEATIKTTTGAVRFDDNGRHRLNGKTDCGSVFEALVKMTRADFEQICIDVEKIIIPADADVEFNGEQLKHRKPIHSFETTLPTVIADAEGNLGPTKRKTIVEVYEVLEGEPASVYELGIPVVATEDKWHYVVMQKVPLNSDRDNVTPAYLSTLRVTVLNEMHSYVTPDDSSEKWVRDAAGDKRCDKPAFDDVMTKRFGEKKLVRDLSDPESAINGFAAGYNVLSGRMLSGGEWDNLKRHQTAPSSSSVFPTRRPYSDDPNAPEVKVIDPAKYTSGMKQIVSYMERIGSRLIDKQISIRIVNTTNYFAGAWGGLTLDLNLFRLGKKWFEGGITEEVDRLFLHELAHHYESNHASDEYHKWCCRLGSRIKQLALDKPELFK